jgi:protein TonB
MLLLLSAAAHYLWLTAEDQVKPVEISGGGQPLPVSVVLSMVTIEPTPKPEHEVRSDVKSEVKPEKKPVKKVEKPQPKKPEPQKKIVQLEEKPPEDVVEDAAPDEVHPLQVEASVLERQPDAPGLASLPVVKQAGFRSRPSPPVYPKLSLRKRQQGEALVQALVNQAGETQEVKLVRSSGYPLLDKSALRAVEIWEFKAALVDNVPVMAWVEVPVAFQINR